MENKLTAHDHLLIKMSIRTRIMWIERNFSEDTFSDLAEEYRRELADLKQLLQKYDSTN